MLVKKIDCLNPYYRKTMTQNATVTIGKRISLISKKNIRYEGLLYSINEQNATVALQNVRSFGTEGREGSDGSGTFVAPSMEVHPYLLFRGQDIKDLHVHDESPSESSDVPQQPSSDATQQNEQQQQELQQPPKQPTGKSQTSTTTTTSRSKPSAGSSATARTIPDPSPPPPPVPITQEATTTKESGIAATKDGTVVTDDNVKRPKQSGGGRGDGKNRRGPKGPAVGTGASLLNRRARGVVKDGPADVVAEDDFDFQSNLEQLKKEEENGDDEAGDATGLDASASGSAKAGSCYEKDSFFDTISCDALDKEQGVDNRLRGTAERQLNTETFGAVALNASGPGGYYRRGGGRSGGRSGGRGGGRSGVGRGGNSNNNPTGRGRGDGRTSGQFSTGRGDGSGRTSRGRSGGRGRRGGGRTQSSDRPIPQVTAS
jgi:protein LSM14